MIAAGDEFSLVIDERGIPWTWGRTDRGQVRARVDKIYFSLFQVCVYVLGKAAHYMYMYMYMNFVLAV